MFGGPLTANLALPQDALAVLGPQKSKQTVCVGPMSISINYVLEISSNMTFKS
jgi:hypothetical protein